MKRCSHSASRKLVYREGRQEENAESTSGSRKYCTYLQRMAACPGQSAIPEHSASHRLLRLRRGTFFALMCATRQALQYGPLQSVCTGKMCSSAAACLTNRTRRTFDWFALRHEAVDQRSRRGMNSLSPRFFKGARVFRSSAVFLVLMSRGTRETWDGMFSYGNSVSSLPHRTGGSSKQSHLLCPSENLRSCRNHPPRQCDPRVGAVRDLILISNCSKPFLC